MATIIKNGLIYDGSGGEPRAADLLIRGKVIAGIGSFVARKKADTVVDASGCIVTPGFIDPASDAEWFGIPGAGLFSEFALDCGITSLMIGASGESIVPMSSMALGRTMASARAGENYHWHTIREFLEDDVHRAINVGLLIGFSSVRNLALLGASRDLTKSELHAVCRTIRTGISGGAFGVSINCSDEHLPPIEISEVIKEVAAARSRLVLLARSHKEERFRSALEEAAALKVPVFARIPWAVRSSDDRAWILKLAEKGTPVGVCPSGSYRISIRDLMPDWAYGFSEPHDGFTREIAAQLRPYEDDGLVITDAGREDLSFLEGVPVAGFAERRGIDFSRAMLLLNSLSSGRMRFVAARDSAVWEKAAVHPNVIAEWGIPDAERSPAAFLRSVSLTNPSALPQAVRNLSASAAAFFGIDRRGILAEGMFADVVVLKNWRAEAVFVQGIRASRDHADRTGGILKSKYV